MRIESSLIPLFCAVAPVAAQFGLSLGPGFKSFTQELHSILDPSETPARLPQPTHIANTPEPQTPVPQTHQTPQSPSPSPSVVAPPIKQSSVPPTTTSLSSHLVVTSSSTPVATITKDHSQHEQQQQQQPVASSKPTASSSSSSSSSGGLSNGAKLGIGLTIGLLALCGLIGAGIYSFIKDRRASQAWADWRERRRAKHRRLNSTTGSISSFRGLEKEKDFSSPDYGNGTLLNRPAAATSESTQSLVDEMPEPVPAVTYQQARMVHIKRKAVPGLPTSTDEQAPPPSQPPVQQPAQSYVPYSSRQPSQPQRQHPMSERMPASLQVRNQPPPHGRPLPPFHRMPRPPQMRQPPPHARMQRPRYSWNQPPLQVRNPSPLAEQPEAPRFSWMEDGR